MGWLHEMTWIDIVLMITFVVAFWAMVLALANSLFGGQRHQHMTDSPINGATIPTDPQMVSTPTRFTDHDER